MSFKKILVPVLDGTSDLVALKAALTMACRYNAHVDALHIREEPSTAASRDISRTARSRFMAAATAFGVGVDDGVDDLNSASASWHEGVIRFPEEIGLAARNTDLVVFAADTIDLHSKLGRVLQATLLESGHPVLIVPGSSPAPFGRRVAVAWNGDREARHAISSALPLLRRADAVFVLCDPALSRNKAQAQQLQDFLRQHDLEAEIIPIEAQGRRTDQALVDRAKALGADILVMGAHPVPFRASQGSEPTGTVTRHVLDHVDMPTLLAS